MTPADYPCEVYRPASRALRQGDIGVCEHIQLRPRSGERSGPAEAASVTLPFFGTPQDHELELDDGSTRVVRMWQGLVLVVSQNCEIEHADSEDSRLHVAPLASPAIWPEGAWEWLRRNRLPGYLYLPEAAEFKLPECVAVFASTTLVSRGLVRQRRLCSLTQPMLPHLQEKLSRFFTTRGYASDSEAGGLSGKRIVAARRTDETVTGPSRLYKLVLAADDEDDGDDELTVTVGFR